MNKKTKVIAVSPVAVHISDSLPLLYSSQPAAGFPAPGDDMVERPLDLNDLLIDNPSTTFFVRVSGDSMTGAGIFDGDYLIVDRAILPTSGKIVVAAVFGELVVKRLSSVGSKTALLSENADYEPIIVDGQDDVFVWGVVIGSARVFS